ncbi:MAG: GNAT family N-acetyltransferase [Myxococcaceae bacterium]
MGGEVGVIGLAFPTDLPDLAAALSQEFIFRKGRTLGVDQRFPSVFASGENFIVWREKRIPVAAAAARPFVLEGPDGPLSAAMVGLVWTHPDHRGKGFGAQVMRGVREIAQAKKHDVLVLWTSIHDFYRKLGWIDGDRSLFGRLDGKATTRGQRLIDFTKLDALRAAHQPWRVRRGELGWRSIPVPATEVELFTTEGGYALAGREGTTGFVYEVVGDEAAVRRLGEQLLSAYDRLNVNERVGSVSSVWFEGQGAQLAPQTQTMWLPLTEAGKAAAAAAHISYFDRI